MNGLEYKIKLLFESSGFDMSLMNDFINSLKKIESINKNLNNSKNSENFIKGFKIDKAESNSFIASLKNAEAIEKQIELSMKNQIKIQEELSDKIKKNSLAIRTITVNKTTLKKDDINYVTNNEKFSKEINSLKSKNINLDKEKLTSKQILRDLNEQFENIKSISKELNNLQSIIDKRYDEVAKEIQKDILTKNKKSELLGKKLAKESELLSKELIKDKELSEKKIAQDAKQKEKFLSNLKSGDDLSKERLAKADDLANLSFGKSLNKVKSNKEQAEVNYLKNQYGDIDNSDSFRESIKEQIFSKSLKIEKDRLNINGLEYSKEQKMLILSEYANKINTELNIINEKRLKKTRELESKEGQKNNKEVKTQGLNSLYNTAQIESSKFKSYNPIQDFKVTTELFGSRNINSESFVTESEKLLKEKLDSELQYKLKQKENKGLSPENIEKYKNSKIIENETNILSYTNKLREKINDIIKQEIVAEKKTLNFISHQDKISSNLTLKKLKKEYINSNTDTETEKIKERIFDEYKRQELIKLNYFKTEIGEDNKKILLDKVETNSKFIISNLEKERLNRIRKEIQSANSLDEKEQQIDQKNIEIKQNRNKIASLDLELKRNKLSFEKINLDKETTLENKKIILEQLINSEINYELEKLKQKGLSQKNSIAKENLIREKYVNILKKIENEYDNESNKEKESNLKKEQLNNKILEAKKRTEQIDQKRALQEQRSLEKQIQKDNLLFKTGKFDKQQYKISQQSNDLLNRGYDVGSVSNFTKKSLDDIALKRTEYIAHNLENIRTATMVMNGLLAVSVGYIFEMGSQFEQYRIKLYAVTKDLKETNNLMEYMKKYAVTTPFNVQDLVKAGVQLRIYDQDIKSTLPIVAALASAMGRDIEGASLAFGRAVKGSSYGFRVLRESYGVSTLDLQKFGAVVQNGKLLLMGHANGVERARDALIKLIDVKYGDMIDMQSNTAATAVSNLQDVFVNAMDDIGKEVLPTFKSFARILTETAQLASGLNKSIGGWLPVIFSATFGITGFLGALAIGGTVLRNFVDFTKASTEWNAMNTVSEIANTGAKTVNNGVTAEGIALKSIETNAIIGESAAIDKQTSSWLANTGAKVKNFLLGTPPAGTLMAYMGIGAVAIGVGMIINKLFVDEIQRQENLQMAMKQENRLWVSNKNTIQNYSDTFKKVIDNTKELREKSSELRDENGNLTNSFKTLYKFLEDNKIDPYKKIKESGYTFEQFKEDAEKSKKYIEYYNKQKNDLLTTEKFNKLSKKEQGEAISEFGKVGITPDLNPFGKDFEKNTKKNKFMKENRDNLFKEFLSNNDILYNKMLNYQSKFEQKNSIIQSFNIKAQADKTVQESIINGYKAKGLVLSEEELIQINKINEITQNTGKIMGLNLILEKGGIKLSKEEKALLKSKLDIQIMAMSKTIEINQLNYKLNQILADTPDKKLQLLNQELAISKDIEKLGQLRLKRERELNRELDKKVKNDIKQSKENLKLNDYSNNDLISGVTDSFSSDKFDKNIFKANEYKNNIVNLKQSILDLSEKSKNFTVDNLSLSDINKKIQTNKELLSQNKINQENNEKDLDFFSFHSRNLITDSGFKFLDKSYYDSILSSGFKIFNLAGEKQKLDENSESLNLKNLELENKKKIILEKQLEYTSAINDNYSNISEKNKAITSLMISQTQSKVKEDYSKKKEELQTTLEILQGEIRISQITGDRLKIKQSMIDYSKVQVEYDKLIANENEALLNAEIATIDKRINSFKSNIDKINTDPKLMQQRMDFEKKLMNIKQDINKLENSKNEKDMLNYKKLSLEYTKEESSYYKFLGIRREDLETVKELLGVKKGLLNVAIDLRKSNMSTNNEELNGLIKINDEIKLGHDLIRSNIEGKLLSNDSDYKKVLILEEAIKKYDELIKSNKTLGNSESNINNIIKARQSTLEEQLGLVKKIKDTSKGIMSSTIDYENKKKMTDEEQRAYDIISEREVKLKEIQDTMSTASSKDKYNKIRAETAVNEQFDKMLKEIGQEDKKKSSKTYSSQTPGGMDSFKTGLSSISDETIKSKLSKTKISQIESQVKERNQVVKNMTVEAKELSVTAGTVNVTSGKSNTNVQSNTQSYNTSQTNAIAINSIGYGVGG